MIQFMNGVARLRAAVQSGSVKALSPSARNQRQAHGAGPKACLHIELVTNLWGWI